MDQPERFPAAEAKHGSTPAPKWTPVPQAKPNPANEKFFAVPNGLLYEKTLRNLVNDASSGKDPQRRGKLTELKVKFLKTEAFAVQAFLFEDINTSPSKGYVKQYLFIHLGSGANVHSYIARANTLILPPAPTLTITKGTFTDSGQTFSLSLTALNAIDSEIKKLCEGQGLKRASGLITLSSMDCEKLVAPK